MLIFLIVIIGLSILILGHEAGHFFVAKIFGMKIDEFGFGFPPKIFGRKKGETEYSLNLLPFGGFVKIAGENERIESGLEKLSSLPDEEKKRLFCFQPPHSRALVIAAGVFVNFLIGWLLISAVFMVGTPRALIISQVLPGSPAAAAGFREGDVVKDYTGASDFIKFVNDNRGREISVYVLRGGKELSLSATPRVNVGPNEGALGVAIAEAGMERQGFFSAISNGFKESLAVVGLTFQALYQLAANLILRGSLLAGVVGPVGIFSVAEETGRIGLIYLLQLVSLISLNLAVVNLIPFPALDGGRLLLILIEKVKGSPISQKTEAFVNGLGFALLVFLMVLITARDIGQLF
jgi:regulator of sigma E protease